MFWLSKAGDQEPATPLLETVGKTSASFIQIESGKVNVGKVWGTTWTVVWTVSIQFKFVEINV